MSASMPSSRRARAIVNAAIENLEMRRLLALTITPYDPIQPLTNLTDALIVPGTGLNLVNSIYIGANGQGGTYSGFDLSDGTNSLTIPDGVLLTSGLATNALGPNNSSGTGATTNTGGDPDLNALISGTTRDRNALTIDFTAHSSITAIQLQFVFGSEEFPEFVGSFNDVFAAYLDGVQISFDSNSDPITVNNNFFQLNNSGNTSDPDTIGKTVVNFDIEYDGLTTLLATNAPLNTSLTTHTLKFVIADAGDTALDSGVFMTRLQGTTDGGGGPVTGTPPTAEAGGPYDVNVNGSIVLSGSGTDPDQASNTLTYEWDLDGDNVFGEAGETGATPTFNAPSIAGPVIVTLKVIDSDGLSDTDTATINVNSQTNQPPTAGAGGPYVINEGDGVSLSATADDPDADPLTLTWDINGDGTFGDATGQTPSLTWAQLNALGITDGNASAVYNVSVQVDDGHGNVVTSSSTTLTVDNVDPDASATGPAAAVPGQLVHLGGSFTDPGNFDTHTQTWEVRDPSDAVVASGIGPSYAFTPTTLGTYTAYFTVTDDDGGADTATHNIAVTQTLVAPSPCNPSEMVLSIGGTNDDDFIHVKKAGNTGAISVVLNGVTLGSWSAFDTLVVYALGGNDNVQVNGSVDAKAVVFGQDGNDRLFSGGAQAALVGGNGDDDVKGAQGRDLLIGGLGADHLNGGPGEDILIAGYTDYDSNVCAISALLAEWTRTDLELADRVINLRSGGGLNGTNVLNGTAHDDGAFDQLNGASASDWYFTNTSAPSDVLDIINGKTNGELLDELN